MDCISWFCFIYLFFCLFLFLFSEIWDPERFFLLLYLPLTGPLHTTFPLLTWLCALAVRLFPLLGHPLSSLRHERWFFFGGLWIDKRYLWYQMMRFNPPGDQHTMAPDSGVWFNKSGQIVCVVPWVIDCDWHVKVGLLGFLRFFIWVSPFSALQLWNLRWWDALRCDATYRFSC